MSMAVAAYHGAFGRAVIYQLNRPIKPHAHREGHLIFHLDGPSAWSRTQRGAALLATDRAAAINPWEPHEFIPGDRHSGSKYLVLYISPAWFAEAGRDSSAPLRFGQPELTCSPRIALLLTTLHHALLGAGPNLCLDTLIYDLAAACFTQSWNGRSAPQTLPRAAPVPDFRIRKSLQLIAERVGSELEFDAVARDSGLSRPHFYKLFRETIGVTPHVYLSTLRMERAIDRLTTTAQSVTDISLALGFETHSGFTRFFAQHVGVAPAEYRRAAILAAA
jgi:AraC-like DNA-binding protein